MKWFGRERKYVSGTVRQKEMTGTILPGRLRTKPPGHDMGILARKVNGLTGRNEESGGKLRFAGLSCYASDPPFAKKLTDGKKLT